MKLDLYFGSRLLRVLFIVAVIFSLLVFMIESLEQIREFSKFDLGPLKLVTVSLLRVPDVLYKIMPMVVVIAALSFYLGLARSSELIVARASGRSVLRHMLAPVLATLLVGVMTIAILHPVVTATQNQYETQSRLIKNSANQTFSISSEGLWLREGTESEQKVIKATQANADGTVLYDVQIFGQNAEYIPTYRIHAKTATLTDGEWVLEGVKRWPLIGTNNPEADAAELSFMTIPSTLEHDDIVDSVTDVSDTSFWATRSHVEKLEAAGFSARSLRMQFQAQLALPLVFLAMLLIAAVFAMRHTRLGGTSMAVFYCVLTAFVFFFTVGFAQVLGENGKLPILLAAWVPPTAMLLITLALLLHLEDG